ncbi:MAG: DEAD/DEAH box helicase [Micrococcales bacterium 73-15]|uniref:DEAD/DEAH box helicase n=1 Tax=Salana multivorans TaxID=120377 RepID=UPI00095F3EF3|nr:DEAD/DEAH box helicase [Salana multivorans]OJX96098.1 MAG: DEAD/DEAH box helicase [Micrococcales bacterium 73-15]
MSTFDPLASLLTTPQRRESLLHVADLPPVDGERADWPTWADDRLVAAYRGLGVERPWAHQVEAATHLHEGRHTVIATATGSGKSLALWLPTLSRVLDHERTQRAGGGPGSGSSLATLQRRPTALYLSPTKALAADQLAALGELVGATDPALPVRITTCDGDTPRDERDWARNHADVVLTNPDFLHFALLPAHERWTRLLRSLSVVVLDEAHAYRGVFGAHVALVLRRLLRLARDLGARPVVAAASATAGEPDLTLARLIGADRADVASVTASTARQGRRRIALWEPAPLDSRASSAEPAASSPDEWAADGLDLTRVDLGDVAGLPDDLPRRSAQSEVIDLLTDLTRARARTLAFVRSRAGVEAVAAAANERLADDPSADASWDEPSAGHPWDDEDPIRTLEAGGSVPVAAYRGGYLPEERRTLEVALRSGRLLGLATTNALELGIDVSGLDAVLLTGWPGTRVSFWQQAGRAGRAGAEGLAVLVAGANPLDTYLVHHPEEILDQGVEVTTFDPSNPYVLGPHLCAAAAELPLTEADLPLFGLPDAAVLDALAERGLLRRRPAGWYWNHARPEAPTDLADLRGTGGRGVPVVEAASGAVLGTVDDAAADASVHPGAVYVHQGRSFVVDALVAPGEVGALAPDDAEPEDDAVPPSDATDARPARPGARVALVHREDVEYRTSARSARQAALLGVRRRAQWGPVTWAFGPVEVTSRVTSYDIRRPPRYEVVASAVLDLPERRLPTTGAWWSVATEVLTEELGLAAGEVPGALHAAEHAMIGVLPLLATCDRWDIGGLSTALHPDTQQPTVVVHDGHPGGAGFAERGFEAATRWVGATYEAVASCRCSAGCPRCVLSPKCGNGNAPIDKAGALRVLRFLRTVAPPS